LKFIVKGFKALSPWPMFLSVCIIQHSA